MEKRLIETKNLIIKNLQASDEDELVTLFENEDIKKTYMIPDYDSRDKVVELAKKQIVFSSDDKHYIYGVHFDNKLIGFINDCGIEDGIIEMGYFIDPAYQNRGFASESFKAVIDDLFKLGFKAVRAGYFEENIASKRVMEKCGLKSIAYEDDEEYKGVMHHCKYMEIQNNL